MCGIAGKLSFDRARPVERSIVGRMTAALRHRGPDDEGVWTENEVGLGNRRLAVIDLSPLGHQPMSNEDGSIHIAYNGEIYNFPELRVRLEKAGHRFRSHTDTETIVHLYEEEGLDCVKQLRGMFAFALWDAPRRRLFMARDRLGKKPLYYARGRDALTFASEAKALFQDPDLQPEPDAEALDHFLTYGYVPGDLCAFKGVAKLPPGHHLVVEDGRVHVQRYWELHYEPKRRDAEATLVEELRDRLEDAVRVRLISDVPVGVLLSGGLDSSAVVATMRRITSGPIRTFSIGFGRAEYNELAHARDVARVFETEHRELVVEPRPEGVLDEIAQHYSEPFADSSALPALAVCRMAREAVTVVLGGDGGDESFLGYDRYRATVLAQAFDRVPAGIRRVAARAAALLPNRSPKSVVGRIRRFGEVLELAPQERYRRWTACFDEAAKAELYETGFAERCRGSNAAGILARAYGRSDARSFLEATAHADVQIYLPDDLLVKMDIASMAHSLEARSPLLDHTLVEFAASLPGDLKLRGRTQKYILKQAMRGVLPDAILDRPKMGFGVPIEHWLRSDLRNHAYDLLLDSRTLSRGYFRREAVQRLLDEHMAGRVSHHFQLWALLVLEMWHRAVIDVPIARPIEVVARL